MSPKDSSLAATTLLASPDEGARRDLLPGIASGETIATLAFTEDDGSWDPSAIRMTAVKDGEPPFCWVVEDGKAVRWQVRTGFRDATHVEVLQKKRPDAGSWQDFTGDEDVIVAPPAGLSDGQAVTVATGG